MVECVTNFEYVIFAFWLGFALQNCAPKYNPHEGTGNCSVRIGSHWFAYYDCFLFT